MALVLPKSEISRLAQQDLDGGVASKPFDLTAFLIRAARQTLSHKSDGAKESRSRGAMIKRTRCNSQLALISSWTPIGEPSL